MSVVKNMSDEELNVIRQHSTDSLIKWNVVVAQSDRKKLLDEVDRLRRLLREVREPTQEH